MRPYVPLVLLLGALTLVAVAFRRDLRADEGGSDEVLEDHQCLACHGFEKNEDGAPYVNGHGYLASRHAKSDIDCLVCHENHEDYPHPKGEDVVTAQCGECHEDAFDKVSAGPHAGLLGEDAEDADTTAACAACHNAHALEPGCAECHEDTWADLGNCVHMTALAESEAPFDPAPCIGCHDGHRSSYGCGDCHEDVFDEIKESVHGRLLGEPTDLQTATVCVGCHGSPHGIPGIGDRQAPLHPFNVPRTCGTCHFVEETELKAMDVADVLGLLKSSPVLGMSTKEIIAQKYMDDTHGHALLESGLLGAPTCISCHGAHGILASTDPESPVHHHNVSEDCGKCHLGILERYRDSVHGRRMAELQGNGGKGREPATCTECHTPHGIRGIDDHFKVEIIETCSRCHGERGSTYRGTYHGRVTEIGFGGVASCDECHTAHEIQPTDDPRSSMHYASGNRRETCARCHPGASDEFARYLVHVDPTREDAMPTGPYTKPTKEPDASWYATWGPILFWVRRLMRGLIFVTWALWGIHMLLWFFRAWRDRKQMRAHLQPLSGRWYRRWPWTYRAIHLTLVVSFLLLAMTGLPLRFHEAEWSRAVFDVFGGPEHVRTLHRVGAALTFGYGIAFIAMIAVRLVRGERGLFRGPNSLLPRLQDVKDMGANLRYFLKGGKPPNFDRWTYYEKFDFLAEVWGFVVIGFTGLIMWFPIAFTSFLPGPAVNLAHIVHSYEALLATSFIFTIHFFNANLRPGKFPVDHLFLTGRISEEEMRHERPAEYERMRADGRLESEALPPPRPRRIRRARRLGIFLLSIGLLLLALMVYAMAVYGVE